MWLRNAGHLRVYVQGGRLSWKIELRAAIFFERLDGSGESAFVVVVVVSIKHPVGMFVRIVTSALEAVFFLFLPRFIPVLPVSSCFLLFSVAGGRIRSCDVVHSSHGTRSS